MLRRKTDEVSIPKWENAGKFADSVNMSEHDGSRKCIFTTDHDGNQRFFLDGTQRNSVVVKTLDHTGSRHLTLN